MLRVETQELDGALICRLEGRFTGEGAEEVRRLVTRCDSKLELVVDLTDVMFIDAIGEEVLLFVKRLGAQFVAETSYSRDVANGLTFRLLASVSRTCKCQLIRPEAGIVLAADDQAHRTGHRAGCRVIARQETGIRGPRSTGSPTQVKSGFLPTESSAHGYCHFVPKQLQCPHTVTF